MKPKPKGYISTYEAPTIITSNPEELTMDLPETQPTDSYHNQYDQENDYIYDKEENFREGIYLK